MTDTPIRPLPVDDSGEPIETYGEPKRRASFIAAMRRITVPAEPRIYLAGFGPKRVKSMFTLPGLLPDGVKIEAYDSVFADSGDYAERWEAYLATVDGLVVVGDRKAKKGRTFRVGPLARLEVKAVVAAGLPVLLHADDYGLVPIVDCAPRRFVISGADRLALRVAPAWNPASETLAAALQALTPAPQGA